MALESGEADNIYVTGKEKMNLKKVERYPDGTFKPDDIITKEQMVAITGRWLKAERGYTEVQSAAAYIGHLSDESQISEWAREEVAFAIRENLIDILRKKNKKL